MDIYVSNGFIGGSISNSVALLHRAGFYNIELSSGVCNSESLQELKKLHMQGRRFRLHNYFPNIGKPFVLNLSSKEKNVRLASAELVSRALEWSSELESDYYAFHAGFRLSPKVSELGGNLSQQDMISIKDAKNFFMDELVLLAERAEHLGVELAVENNVYDARNYALYGQDNPFLLSGDSSSDLELPEKVGILLDVGHLKVSAQSLGLNPIEVFERWKNKITGYHISDNNGAEDSNAHINEDSWFWSILDTKIKRVTLEVYDRNFDSLEQDIFLLRSNLL